MPWGMYRVMFHPRLANLIQELRAILEASCGDNGSGVNRVMLVRIQPSALERPARSTGSTGLHLRSPKLVGVKAELGPP